MRIVLDTNILVSALISGEGTPGQVLAAVKSLGITLTTSRFQVDELREVLARDWLQPYIRRESVRSLRDMEDDEHRYPSIARRPAISDQEADDLLYHLEAVAVVVNDNPVLATAIAGDADLIVSGDRDHMLAVGSADGIPIITAREAADRLRAGEED